MITTWTVVKGILVAMAIRSVFGLAVTGGAYLLRKPLRRLFGWGMRSFATMAKEEMESITAEASAADVADRAAMRRELARELVDEMKRRELRGDAAIVDDARAAGYVSDDDDPPEAA